MNEFGTKRSGEGLGDSMPALAGLALESAQDQVLWVDAAGRFVFANGSACRMLEYTREELLAMSVADISPDFIPQIWDEHWRELKEAGRLVLEVRQRSRSGKSLLIEISATYLQHDGREYSCAFGKDISERVQIEQKFSIAFSQAPLLMAINDLQNGEFLEANNKFCEVSGFSHNELAGKTSKEIGWMSPDDCDGFMEILRQGGRVPESEVVFKAKDGRSVTCLYSAEKINLEGRDCLLSTTVDITQRKNDQKALDYANQCFEQALNGPRHILYRLNIKKGCYDYLSQTIERFTGHPYAQFKQISLEMLIEYLHPDDRGHFLNRIHEQMSQRVGNTFSLEVEYRFRKADGTYFWVHDASTGCLDQAGELEYFFGSAFDITERKRIEGLLSQSEESYRLLVEQSVAWIWTANAALKHTYSNDNVLKILGYSSRELCAMNILELVHADDHDLIKKKVHEAISERCGWNGVVLRWLARDGSWRFIESSGAPIFDDEGTLLGLQGANTDITERLLLEQEREKGQRLESLGLLAGGIAHDFNNILTGIAGNLSLAKMMIENDYSAMGRLEECEKAAKRASQLTQQLLTFARGGEPVKKTVDLARLVNEAASFNLRGSSSKVVLLLNDDLWPIDADEGQISQVLNNLLINAAQAMPEGGTVTVRADNLVEEATSDKPERFVRLIVSDSGSGIPADILQKIFDPYFTTKARGTGLGLSSVYSIVKRHGGTVTVSSKIGRGSEFVIRLPAASSTKASGPELQAAPQGVTVSGGRVLVMDDDEIIIDVVSMMLTGAGCEVDTCNDGDETFLRYQMAVEQGLPYDVVFLDLTMPGGMGGREVAARIRAIDPHAAMIVSSGYSDDAVMSDFYSHGFSGALTKPFEMDSLMGEFNRVMGMRRTLPDYVE